MSGKTTINPYNSPGVTSQISVGITGFNSLNESIADGDGTDVMNGSAGLSSDFLLGE